MTTIYSGYCIGGPRDNTSMVQVDKRKVEDEGGFYVYAPAVRGGAMPAGWRWIPAESTRANQAKDYADEQRNRKPRA
jgi:hypothetical protein